MENIPSLLDKYSPDCVADAIDNITAKLSLVVECDKKHLASYGEYVVKEEKIY